MHGVWTALLSYYVMFLATPYPQTRANYGVIVRCVGCLYMLFISNTGFCSSGDMEPGDGLRQNELSDSEICDQ